MDITRDNLLSLVRTGMKEQKLSIARLEKQAGVPKDTVRDFLRARTQILRADKLQKILRVLEPEQRLAIRSFMGRDGEILPYPEGKLSYTDFPPGIPAAGVEALRVEGDAMMPVFQEGWVLYYSTAHQAQSTLKSGWNVPYHAKEGETSPYADRLGKPCVILLQDERLMLRTLREGKTPGTYTLVAYNAPDLKDVMIRDAYKIAFIKTA